MTDASLEHDISALDRGVLTYRLPAAVRTGTPFVLTVTVTDVGKARPGVITATEASRQLGLTVFPKDVPAGAFVGLTTVSCTNLRCRALNSQSAQPVIGEGSSRTWSWTITPGNPGPASLVVNATTFEGQSSSSLSQVLVPITMKVTATTGFTEQQPPDPAPGGRLRQGLPEHDDRADHLGGRRHRRPGRRRGLGVAPAEEAPSGQAPPAQGRVVAAAAGWAAALTTAASRWSSG